MYVPIPGMVGDWVTVDGFEWVCYVLLGLGIMAERQQAIVAAARNGVVMVSEAMMDISSHPKG
jgi:hypothetical protein